VAVAVSTFASTHGSTQVATSADLAITVPNSTMLLVAFMYSSGNTSNLVTATLNSTSMTKSTWSSANNVSISMFTMFDPSAGASTIKFDFGGATIPWAIGWVLLSEVDSTTPLTTWAANSGNSTLSSISLAADSSGLVLHAAMHANADPTTGSGEVLIWDMDFGGVDNRRDAVLQTKAVSSAIMDSSWGWSVSNEWVQAALSVRSEAAAPPTGAALSFQSFIMG